MSNIHSLTRLEAVNLRLAGLGVYEADMSEQFIHSGGKGGQNVNKVSTAVRLTCKKENEDVKCMQERSQLLNRVRAREILVDRIEKKRKDAKLLAIAEAQRLRRLKAGRPRSIKRMILKNKRIKSKTKQNRNYRPGRDD